ncbi:MAG: M28 family metallopeptidase [Myxococcota bacterium]|nr:M28 family metallopeptidase [Myxococcota bacterium]
MWFFLACTSPPTDSSADTDWLTAQKLSEMTHRLTDLGPRQVATDAEPLAAAVVEAMLLEGGLEDVERAPFVWDAWLPGEASITLSGQTFSAEPLSPSPTTTGLTGTLTSGATSGGIALFSSDDGSRAEQFVLALTSGADAMIRITEHRDEDGGPLIEVGHTLEGSRLPAVAVDAETGAALKAAIGQTVTLDLTTTTVPDHTSENLVGWLEGSASSATVALTAHYDSWHPSESAADNAIGVAMAALLAADIAQTIPDRRLLVLLTSGEEQGLQGANRWVADNASLAGAVNLVINLDIPWSDEGMLRCGCDNDGVMAEALAALEEEGLSAEDVGAPWPASDHLPFQTRGADALWCTRQPYRRYHTEADIIDIIDMEQAASVMRAHAAVLRAALTL